MLAQWDLLNIIHLAKLKVNISCLNVTQAKQVSTYLPHTVTGGIIALGTLTAFRTQITAASNNTLSPKEIQGLESQRRIAKLFNTKEVSEFLALLAIATTLFADLPALSKLALEEIPGFLEDKISEVLTPGKARILTTAQLDPSDTEVINTHRRGLVSQSKGRCQSSPIFEHTTVVSGINPLMLGKTGLFQAIREISLLIGINIDTSIFDLFKSMGVSTVQLTKLNCENLMELYICGLFTGLPDTERQNWYLDRLENPDGDKTPVVFADAITLSDSPNNLLNLEQEILTTHLEIRRTTTPIITEIPSGDSNPLAAIAARQLRQHATNLKKGKIKTSPIKAVPPSSLTGEPENPNPAPKTSKTNTTKPSRRKSGPKGQNT